MIPRPESTLSAEQLYSLLFLFSKLIKLHLYPNWKEGKFSQRKAKTSEEKLQVRFSSILVREPHDCLQELTWPRSNGSNNVLLSPESNRMKILFPLDRKSLAHSHCEYIC